MAGVAKDGHHRPGRRRQGHPAGQSAPKTQASIPDAIPESDAPALRSLAELEKRFNMARQERASDVNSGNEASYTKRGDPRGHGVQGGYEQNSGNGTRRQRPRGAEAQKPRNPSNAEDAGPEAGALLLKMLKSKEEKKHDREFLLKLRTRPGKRPEAIKKLSADFPAPARPLTATAATDECPRTGTPATDDCPQNNDRVPRMFAAAAKVQKRVTQLDSEPSVTPSLGAQSADDLALSLEPAGADTFFLEDDEEQELPAGQKESLGFRKWFSPSSRNRKGSSASGGAMLGEAGGSTDAGSGVDESCSDGEVSEAVQTSA